LKSFVLPEIAVTSDGLHFVLRFSVDKVRRGSREVGTVGVSFYERSEKGVMEDRMNVPRDGELES
jgi:hypothetical protein